MKHLIIAIDGHAGCGKSSTAKAVAKALDYLYIDSGAMYRAVTLYFIQNHINFEEEKEVSKALKSIQLSFQNNPKTGHSEIYLNGVNIESFIRTMQVSSKVSDIAAIPSVRHYLVKMQQALGNKSGIVMDGRDIGTVVFPQADLKIYMTADIIERARRRKKELEEKGQFIEFDAIVENIKNRDYVDANRKEGPLRKADDAIVINTTKMTLEEQVNKVLTLVKKLSQP